MDFTVRRFFLTAAGVAALSGAIVAQDRAAVTAADYARAERFMSYNVNPLVLHGGVRATWIADDRFWYSTTGENGTEAWLVNAKAKTRTICDLPACRTTASPEPSDAGTKSPDGTKTAFIRDWNLWIREQGTNHETALTTDGIKDFGYATDNAGWTRRRACSGVVSRLEKDRHLSAGSAQRRRDAPWTRASAIRAAGLEISAAG
jgi:hypothetical protein